MTEANLFAVGLFGWLALVVVGAVVSIIAGFIRPTDDTERK